MPLAPPRRPGGADAPAAGMSESRTAVSLSVWNDIRPSAKVRFLSHSAGRAFGGSISPAARRGLRGRAGGCPRMGARGRASDEDPHTLDCGWRQRGIGGLAALLRGIVREPSHAMQTISCGERSASGRLEAAPPAGARDCRRSELHRSCRKEAARRRTAILGPNGPDACNMNGDLAPDLTSRPYRPLCLHSGIGSSLMNGHRV